MSRETVIIKDVLRYVQMPYEVADETLKKRILSYYEHLERCVYPKWVFQSFAIHKEKNTLHFEGTTLSFESEDLSKVLESSKSCFIVAATLGIEADRLIQKAQIQDMTDALFLNACANVMIEEVCDKVEQEIASRLEPGAYLTMRYSPGYGDVPLAMQNQILNVLDTSKKIGLALSQGGMLMPLKSITAFIGVSSQKENRIKSCKTCMMQKHCVYQKRGEVCGS